MAVIKNLPATKSLENQLEYLASEGKTLDKLRSGINCTVDNVEMEFNIVKELHNKPIGKQYYHMTQAFSPSDDITPEKCHELGKEWIKAHIQNHQIYMVTHIDKDHLHNHFVINSVNIENGLKLQIKPKKLEEMKIHSNEICLREGYKTINLDKNSGVSKTDSEYHVEKRGEVSWKSEIRLAVDTLKKSCKSIEDLKEFLLNHFDIILDDRGDILFYKHPDTKAWVSENSLGGDYKKVTLNKYFS